MFLPFILVPILAAIIVYASIAIGFMHPFSGVTLPWSTPAIISGFMVGGWQGAFVQVLVLATSTVVYSHSSNSKIILPITMNYKLKNSAFIMYAQMCD